MSDLLNTPSEPKIVDRFLESIELFQAKKTNLNVVGREYLRSSRVNNTILSACWRHKLPHQAHDEIKQDVLELFLLKYASEITPIHQAYSVISTAAEFRAQKQRTRVRETPLTDLLPEPDEEGATADEATIITLLSDKSATSSDGIDEILDSEKAHKEFARRIGLMQNSNPSTLDKLSSEITSIADIGLVMKPGVVKVLIKEPFGQERIPLVSKRAMERRISKAEAAADKAGVNGTGKKSKKNPTEQGDRLNTIRKTIDICIEDFAIMLNISTSSLTSYIYGSVQTVPAKVSEHAETLYKDYEHLNISKVDPGMDLATTQMDKIVNTWIKALGYEGEKVDFDLAALLEVSRPTVWRWRSQDIRPPMRSLRVYDHFVFDEIQKQNRKKQRAASKGAH